MSTGGVVLLSYGLPLPLLHCHLWGLLGGTPGLWGLPVSGWPQVNPSFVIRLCITFISYLFYSTALHDWSSKLNTQSQKWSTTSIYFLSNTFGNRPSMFSLNNFFWPHICQPQLYIAMIFKASALWAVAFYKSKCPSVCLSVRLLVWPKFFRFL